MTIQALVVPDGLGAHANSDISNCPAAVTRMTVLTTDLELGLPCGPHPPSPRDRWYVP
ncbi:hypothetical protein [Streptomyces violascens]|uniref:hypothetical protein n=1 Tax=Streptomyces violascens TaxID=67381 RepID=UPI00367FBEB7